MSPLHGHNHEHKNVGHSKGALKLAIYAIAMTLVAELAGAFWTNSLALFSDVAHVLGDLFSLLFSYFAIVLAQRPRTDTRTFGWHRIEVFAALGNALTVFVMAFFIFFHAIKRVTHPQEILSFEMLVIALIGLAANLFVIWKLHPHLREDINIKSAYIHALGDTLASIAVVISGLIILMTKQKIADPIAAILVSIIIVVSAYKIARDSIQILLEGVPSSLNHNFLIKSIEKISGNQTVSDLHVWNICSHLCALSVHIVLPEKEMARQKEILENVNASLENDFDILHSTIQIESESWHES